MARKLTGRQEAFCLAVVAGKTFADAYRSAYLVAEGRAPRSICKDAMRLAASALVKARILKLRKRVRAKVAEKLAPPASEPVQPVPVADPAENALKAIAVDITNTVFENARIGFSDIRRVWNDDGTLKPPSEWDKDMAAAVASVKVRALFGEGKDGKGQIGETIEVKLWDKGAALDRLMKHLGAYEKDNRQQGGVQALSDEELMQRIGLMFARLGVPMPPELRLPAWNG